MNYTKGEWKVKKFATYYGVRADNSGSVSRVCDLLFDEEGLANANLIAAAPDMYGALKAVKQWQNDPEMYFQEILTIINKALAKAEGK